MASSNDGDVYVSDGGGSGAWVGIHHGTFFSVATQSVTGATTWTDIALELEGHSAGLIHSLSVDPDEITIAQTGHYALAYTIMADSSSGTSIVEARIVIDGTELAGSPSADTLGASDQKSITGLIMTSLSLNEVVKLQFYSDTANGRIIYAGSGATSKVTAQLSIFQIID